MALPLSQADHTAVTEAAVALARSSDRKAAVATVIQSLGGTDCQGKDIYLKANFNSADPFPASTHPETLTAVVSHLKERKPASITLVERSGMGVTRDIWQKLGITDLAAKLDLRLLALEDLPKTDWRLIELTGSHWKKGVEAPRFLTEDVALIQLCNLNTHRFGGQFSASIKNSVGLVAKHAASGSPYNYMAELHSSADQRLMIAEVNQIYTPAMVVMDASEVFISGGPEKGEIAAPQAVLASKDRIAVDAVGIAILKANGATPFLGHTPVFEYDQIKRAAELKLGVTTSENIRLVTNDSESAGLALQIKAILSNTSEEKKP